MRPGALRLCALLLGAALALAPGAAAEVVLNTNDISAWTQVGSQRPTTGPGSLTFDARWLRRKRSS